jgi:endonuclease YncB( thermonuclease family)
LLDEVKKRYPQGRTAVAGMENMIADLGEKVVRDTEERKKRKEEREVAVWTEVGRRDIAYLERWRRRVMLGSSEER